MIVWYCQDNMTPAWLRGPPFNLQRGVGQGFGVNQNILFTMITTVGSYKLFISPFSCLKLFISKISLPPPSWRLNGGPLTSGHAGAFRNKLIWLLWGRRKSRVISGVNWLLTEVTGSRAHTASSITGVRRKRKSSATGACRTLLPPHSPVAIFVVTGYSQIWFFSSIQYLGFSRHEFQGQILFWKRSKMEAVTGCALATISMTLLRRCRRRQKPRSVWVSDVLQKKQEQGAYATFVRGLGDKPVFLKFFLSRFLYDASVESYKHGWVL